MNRYRHDSSAPSHLRKLVESARRDDLDAERRRRVAERLGIVPALPPDPGVEPSSLARPWLSVGGALTAAALIVAAGATYLRAESANDVAPPSAAAAPSAPAVADAPSVVAAPSSVTSVDVAALPDVPVEKGALARATGERPVKRVADEGARSARLAVDPAGVAEPPVAAPALEPLAAASAAESSLKLEILALDRVRRATEGGRPREALALLDAYVARFPAGKLREEATVLRVEALAASGDPDAERLARELLREAPNTPYAARLRAALVSTSRE
ncbi:MAG: tetratricopeptide repeat protein [Labilithrix sp.]|nr:tetratricopeptide repeat protein [Labilithrix sp.]MBX3223956.1 tetratricopeptide repeat protein [Labilithrix sp.]